MNGNEEELLQEEGYALMGAAFEIYNQFGAAPVSNGPAMSSEFPPFLPISVH